jgi:hypothetical protein
MSYPTHCQLLHLRVAAEPDPGVLARVLERFQNLNVTPRRVCAEWRSSDIVDVEVLVAGLPEETLSLIAAKLGQVPTVLHAYWHR